MSAHEVAEHIEHAAHEGHEGGHGPAPRLTTYVGITMALLGVMLAFSAAKVGGERTELIEAMVDQQNAHAKYQSQNIKHRMAVLMLQNLHSHIPTAEGEAGGPRKVDAVELANTVTRYLKESDLAKDWVEAYDPAIKAHVDAQEHFETAQLLAEIGIVVASIALLLHKRIAWFAALALGAGAIAVVVMTYMHTTSIVHTAEQKIEESGKAYRETRNADKTTAEEETLVAEVLKWGGSAAPPRAPGAPAHD